MDFVIEILLASWIKLAMQVIPKSAPKKTKLIAKIIVALIIAFIVSSFAAGSIMISNGIGSRTVGIILIVASVAVFFSQLIAGVFCYNKK